MISKLHFSIVPLDYGRGGAFFTNGLWAHDWNLVALVKIIIESQRSNHVTNFITSRQMSCRGKCKIMTRTAQYALRNSRLYDFDSETINSWWHGSKKSGLLGSCHLNHTPLSVSYQSCVPTTNSTNNIGALDSNLVTKHKVPTWMRMIQSSHNFVHAMHGSSAAVIYAKVWPDWIISITIR